MQLVEVQVSSEPAALAIDVHRSEREAHDKNVMPLSQPNARSNLFVVLNEAAYIRIT